MKMVNLGNEFAKMEQIKAAQYQNQLNQGKVDQMNRGNDLRNIMAQNNGQMNPEVMKQMNQVDPMQAMKIQKQKTEQRQAMIDFQIKGTKWVSLAGRLVKDQKSYAEFRKKGIENGTINPSMSKQYDDDAKQSMKLMVGTADKKMSGIKSGTNPSTGRTGFFRIDKGSGKVQWLDGATPIPKKGQTININSGGKPKLSPGQIWKIDANGNGYVETAPGAKPQTRENAATGQGVQQALKTMREAVFGGHIVNPRTKKKTKLSSIIRKDGSINRGLVLGMYTNFPGSQGRIHRNRFKDALQAKLRAETGAAAPDSEVKNLMDRFMPGSLDSDEEIHDKINRLKNFISGFMARTDPQLYRSLRTLILKKKGTTGAKAEEKIRLELEQGGMRGIAEGRNTRFDSNKQKMLNANTSNMTDKQKRILLKQLKKANGQ